MLVWKLELLKKEILNSLSFYKISRRLANCKWLVVETAYCLRERHLSSS